MGNAKFTMNSLVIIAIIFSAILFFFTIAMVDMANPYAQNEFYPIEGTDELAIKHSSIEPNGIYRGGENTAVLVLEGTYGKDWGTTLAGDKLYLNEYDMTTVGMIIPEIVRVDINTLEKEILYKDAMIRGRCASGEMVCLEGYVMPSNFPETNSLLKFYSMSEKDLDPGANICNVIYIDPETGEAVLTLEEQPIIEKSFESKYIDCTLDEIREEAAS